MQLNVTGHHVEVTPALRGYVLKKLERIGRHFEQVIDVHCVLTVEKLRQKAEATLHVSGARDSEFDPSRWWQTRQGQKLFMSELAGYLVARWELRTKPAPENETAFVISRVPSGWPGTCS